MATFDSDRGQELLAELSLEDRDLVAAIAARIQEYSQEGGALTPIEAAVCAVRVVRERR